MAYVWKGTTAPTPGVPEKAPIPFDPSKCGEARGYKQHRNHGQEPCQPCKDGAAAYRRDWESARVCGTYKGHARHLRHDSPVCDPCREAKNAYVRAQAKNPDGSRRYIRTPFDPSACGTYNGHQRHVRRGLTPCQPCRDAYNVRNRANKAAQRERRAA